MKRFTRFVCLFLITAVLLAVPANAAETSRPRASNFFGMTSTYLWTTSGTQFQVWFEVTAVRGMDKLGANVIKVQRSTDTVNWTDVKTYNNSDYSQMIASDTSDHSSYVTYTGTSGYYYRAYVEFYAKDSSGSGYKSAYTSSIKL